MKKVVLTIFSIVGFYHNDFSQCCAGCNPIGGNTNLGTLPKHMLQINAYHKYGYSAGYKENDHPTDFKFVKNANSNFVGLQLAYGILKRLTVDADVGYYLNRTQNFNVPGYDLPQQNGYGFSSFSLGGRYCIIKDTVHEFEFTAGAAVKMPASQQPLIVNGVELTEDVQPCNGAYGAVIRTFLFKEFDKPKLNLFLMNAININSMNKKEYKEGNTYITSLFASKKLFKNFTTIFQLRNEIRDHCYRHNLLVYSSGGYRFVFVPQINYTIKSKINISALYELPIYQYYNGVQLNDLYAFSINLNIRIGLKKDAELCLQK